jgi:hypothetical protein
MTNALPMLAPTLELVKPIPGWGDFALFHCWCLRAATFRPRLPEAIGLLGTRSVHALLPRKGLAHSRNGHDVRSVSAEQAERSAPVAHIESLTPSAATIVITVMFVVFGATESLTRLSRLMRFVVSEIRDAARPLQRELHEWRKLFRRGG